MFKIKFSETYKWKSRLKNNRVNWRHVLPIYTMILVTLQDYDIFILSERNFFYPSFYSRKKDRLKNEWHEKYPPRKLHILIMGNIQYSCCGSDKDFVVNVCCHTFVVQSKRNLMREEGRSYPEATENDGRGYSSVVM
jgi:endonuclease I